MWRWFIYGGLGLAIAICLIPVGTVTWSSWFAARHGCTLHEGFVNPCVVNGHDYGEALYSAFVLGWLMLATLPIGAILALILIVVLVIDLVRRARRARAAQRPDAT